MFRRTLVLSEGLTVERKLVPGNKAATVVAISKVDKEMRRAKEKEKD